MKKYAFVVIASAFLMGCKKPPVGGNKGVIKLNDTERYDTYETRTGGAVASAEHGSQNAKSEVNVEVNGTSLKAFKGGLEEQMVGFLQSDGYKNAKDDAALKNQWFNFDNVNFKMGSSNQLEAGSEVQIDNLSKILKAFPDAKIRIGGYTDKTGDEAVNKKISLDRANFIKNELTKLGVGSQIVSAEGYGSQFAKIPATASDQERAVDRKMAVRFTK